LLFFMGGGDATVPRSTAKCVKIPRRRGKTYFCWYTHWVWHTHIL